MLRIAMHMEVPDDLVLADPSLHRELSHGWLLPYLWSANSFTWGRWAYWLQAAQTGHVPQGPIPRIDWRVSPAEGGARAASRRMLERSLDAISPGWGGWSTWAHFDYLLDWVLFGCGHRQGFYPTPHTVAECLALVKFSPDQDHRLERVLDPCVGTGRLLLHASNFSLRLFGADIDATLVKACLVNGYLYAPWLVRPLAWLDGAADLPQPAAALDQAIAAAASQAPFATADPDPAAWRFMAIRKRRAGPGSTDTALQGVLF